MAFIYVYFDAFLHYHWLLSGCIWGGTQKFLIGFLKIARLALEACREFQILPGWVTGCRFANCRKKSKLKQTV